MSDQTQYCIDVTAAKTLDGLFRKRVELTPDFEAYRYHDRATKSWLSLSWKQMEQKVAAWQAALSSIGLEEGDRVALMLKNSPDWVAVDIACHSLGVADVPLYTDDRPDNISYIVHDSGAKVLVLQDVNQWKSLAPQKDDLASVQQFVIIDWDGESELPAADERVVAASKWLPADVTELKPRDGDPHK
ncbi:MAG: long-chain fatty acid--CoA ligase, partial [Gammaproteobacteria bacterium]|nr:long-chain fatty acid--CoA ligase [Gammaproteobacteria bacterium]